VISLGAEALSVPPVPKASGIETVDGSEIGKEDCKTSLTFQSKLEPQDQPGHEGAESAAPIPKRTPFRLGGRLKVIHGFLRLLCRCCDAFLLSDLFEEMSDHYGDDCDGAASDPHFYVCE